MDGALVVGVDVEVINGIVFACRANIGRRGKAVKAIRTIEANCVEFVLAGILSLIAVFALRPHDGDVGQIGVARGSREAEIGSDRRGDADALGEVDVVATVGIDTRQTDIVRHVRVMLGVPTDDEVSVALVDRSRLRVGVGVVVVGQTSGGNDIAVRADHGVEGLGGGDVFAGADGVGNDRRTVGKHSGVDGVDRTGSAVVSDLGGRPLGAVEDTVVDIVLHVEHGGDILDLFLLSSNGVDSQAHVVEVYAVAIGCVVGFAGIESDLNILRWQFSAHLCPVLIEQSGSTGDVFPSGAAIVTILS